MSVPQCRGVNRRSQASPPGPPRRPRSEEGPRARALLTPSATGWNDGAEAAYRRRSRIRAVSVDACGEVDRPRQCAAEGCPCPPLDTGPAEMEAFLPGGID